MPCSAHVGMHILQPAPGASARLSLAVLAFALGSWPPPRPTASRPCLTALALCSSATSPKLTASSSSQAVQPSLLCPVPPQKPQSRETLPDTGKTACLLQLVEDTAVTSSVSVTNTSTTSSSKLTACM
eukprot:3715279-Rhodomonas_salina.1